MSSKEIHLHWAFTRESEKHGLDSLIKHQTRPGKENLQYPPGRTGGLGLPKPIFTRFIMADGRLFTTGKDGDVVHIGIQGGLSHEFHYKNTLTREQMITLTNEVRSLHQSFPDMVLVWENFINFDVEKWITSVILR
ncbi:MAG: hypothetical protein ACK5DE_09860 [Bacteroidota bacterium]|jgi:hypothetical protein